jgi:hypothetical protein
MKETKLQLQCRRFSDGEIDKWEFYTSTRWYSAKQIVAAGEQFGTFAGCIDPLGVVRDRRRYLNQLAKQGGGRASSRAYDFVCDYCGQAKANCEAALAGHSITLVTRYERETADARH